MRVYALKMLFALVSDVVSRSLSVSLPPFSLIPTQWPLSSFLDSDPYSLLALDFIFRVCALARVYGRDPSRAI